MSQSVYSPARGVVLLLLACGSMAALAGCGRKQPPIAAPPDRYRDMGAKEGVPDYLKGTIYERVELTSREAYPVSSYGLVGRLRGTGDSDAPTPVRQWMQNEIVRHGFGSTRIPGVGHITPGDVLASPNFAIVEVYGFIPPGAKKDDWIDVFVRCLPKNRTTSLAQGVLFETDLKIDGANPQYPSRTVEVYAKCKGPIVVNPAYADKGAPQTAAAKQSLRSGVVMFNGRVMHDQPLILQLRQPQRSLARAIERRIDEHFQNSNVAAAQDEGIIHLYIPKDFRGDWEHFVGVATHLYVHSSPAFIAAKAKELADEAQKPGAPLLDISYAWEGLGAGALPFLSPLMSHADPNVAFAAARAAAFIGDPSGGAQHALVRIGRTAGHPFQISAIQTLGTLPPSTSLNHMLRELLDSDQNLARIEAYKVLAKNRDPKIFTTIVKGHDGTEKFALDIVPSEGPPVIYASRRGAPRIAIIGRGQALMQPLVFTALDMRLSMTAQPNDQGITLFYRDDYAKPVRLLSRPDVADIIARLGGEGADDEARLDFTYGEILAILQALSDQRKVVAPRGRGEMAVASLVLQEAPMVEQQIEQAPVIGDTARPQADAGGARPQGDDADAVPTIRLAPEVSGTEPAAQARPQ